MTRRTPATKAQRRARLDEILAIRLDGAEFWDVREYVREKEQEQGSPWQLTDGATPLSSSQIRRYIQEVDKVIAASCCASRKKLFRRHLAQRRNLYAKAVNQGDVRAALACVDSEAKLLGLFAPDKLEATGKGGTPLYPPLEAMVAALMKSESSGEATHADAHGTNAPCSDAGDPAPTPGSETVPG